MFWALLTVMMQATEEKWLLEQFGDEYRGVLQRVNRCIPWFLSATFNVEHLRGYSRGYSRDHLLLFEPSSIGELGLI